MTFYEYCRSILRYRWLVLAFGVAGLTAALAVYAFRPPPFRSEAKLFVRYVLTDDRTPTPPTDEARAKSPDKGGETIMMSEHEIITSFDLAVDVAHALTPARVLGAAGHPRELDTAATVIRKGLAVESPARSSVIRLSFSHPTSELVQPVLRAVIDRYLKMHVEIHRADGLVGQFLTQETESLRTRLLNTDEELKTAIQKAGGLVPESHLAIAQEQIAFLERSIYQAQGEIAQLGGTPVTAAITSVVPDDVSTSVTPALVDTYEGLRARAALLRAREQDLLTKFTENGRRVSEVRLQLATTDSAVRAIEAQYPGTNLSNSNQTQVSHSGGTVPNFDLSTIPGLESKIAVWQNKIEEIRAESSRVQGMMGVISQLKTRQALEEANYRYYVASIEQARVSEAMRTGKVSNISEVQAPSPPVRDWTKTIKLMAGLCLAGVALGLGAAYCIPTLLAAGNQQANVPEMEASQSLQEIDGLHRSEVPLSRS